MKKIIIIITLAVFAIAFLAWLFTASSKPLPGEKIADLGREHVEIGTEVEYNSNPPTSGSHYSDWIRSGVYSEVKDDRNLVHSLEHGYVIMSYKCQISTEEGEASQSAAVNEECQVMKDQLTQVYQTKGQRKLIVVPRGDLDANFALTAWNYIDKFDQFDQSRIEKFIDAHLNQGPEKTME